MADKPIIVSTTDTVAGREIAEVLDVVIGTGYAGGTYPDMSKAESRISALNQMKTNARKIGADAVVGMRFDSVVFDYTDWGEYAAYGTAVKLR